MISQNQRFLKRFFDLSISILLLIFTIIPLILLLLIATVNTRKIGLFLQKRIGYLGKPFMIYKIRSLKGADHLDVQAINKAETKFGSWLRRTKLDELPQFFNVIKGEMSLVGPRPDVAGYADRLEGEDRIVLQVKPGITGPATLKYRNEDSLLLEQENPNEFNDSIIWPDKVKINKEYVLNWSLEKDIYYLWVSVFGASHNSEGIH